MHAGRTYSLREVLIWTWRETLTFALLASIPVVLYTFLGWTWFKLPWLPIALIGTAVAFITGFRNSASYARLWEARTVWGGIVNDSRKWGVAVREFVDDEGVKKRLLYRHIAWLTALRYELRGQRSWENMNLREFVRYQRKYSVPEWSGSLESDLLSLLDAEEVRYVLSKKSPATHLCASQAREVRTYGAKNGAVDLRTISLLRVLSELIDHQGKCERIKNFPYPRQYATLNLLFVWLFIALAPYGLIEEFYKLGRDFVWLTIPASVVVCWVLHTMEKIGSSSENPFEGGPNDVPITALSRIIEIDLRQLFDETAVPETLTPVNKILM
jgi:putative membrane protein